MSRVFVADDNALGRKVVVKVLPPDVSGGVNIDRFRREIQLAAQLQHPHIVPLLAASSDRDLLWFTMPFIEGASLQSVLDKSGPLALRDVVRILHDVVDALAYAHTRGIVHRDIKPANILTSGMHALVTDFGVAKALSAASPAAGTGTTTGIAIGTPAYMAPEQLAADPAADHRVDIYAVGLLAYELLTGKSPFRGSSPQATLAAQLTEMPQALHRSLPEVPEQLSQIVMKCLEKDPSRRFQSARELLDALDALPPVSGADAAPMPRIHYRRGVLTGVTIGSLIVLILASLVIWNTREAEDQLVASADSVLFADDSVGMMRLLPLGASVDNDRPSATSVPLVISHAESLAIVAAFQKSHGSDDAGQAQGGQGASGTAAASGASGGGTTTGATMQASRVFVSSSDGQTQQIDRDVLREEVQRIFADSAFRAMVLVDSSARALPQPVRPEATQQSRPGASSMIPLIPPPPEGMLRVAVTPFLSRRGDSTAVTRAGVEMARSIRTALTRSEGIDVPDSRTTEQAFETGNRVVAGWRLRADYVVSGEFLPQNDSIVIVLHFTDVRTGRFARAERMVVPANALMRGFQSATAQVVSWVDTAKMRPRTPPGMRGVEFGPPPGGRGIPPQRPQQRPVPPDSQVDSLPPLPQDSQPDAPHTTLSVTVRDTM